MKMIDGFHRPDGEPAQRVVEADAVLFAIAVQRGDIQPEGNAQIRELLGGKQPVMLPALPALRINDLHGFSP